jgi:hypothetical protein
MGRFTITGLAALGALGWHGGIAAQDSPPALPDDTNTIEVQGDRELRRDEIIRGQRRLYETAPANRTAARFHDPVCIAVVGLEGEQNVVVAQRIRENISAAGIALAGDKCKPNALVAVNRTPKALIGALRIRDPQLFNRESDAAIRRQLAASKPAISWGETILRANDGILYGERQTESLNPDFAVPFYFGALPSRHRAPLYQTKVNAIVVFDLDRLEDVHVNQLADYATLHLLGDPRDPADHVAAGVPTILSLFADGPNKTPLEMTSLDRAYLRGLYRMGSSDWASRLTGKVLASYEKPAAVEDEGSSSGDGTASPS